MTEAKYAPHSNPFSTRFVAPGAIPFEFAPGQDAQQLVNALHAAGNWGEIVGPHGSGKSCLLAELVPLLRNDNRTVVEFALHDGQRRLPRINPCLPDHPTGTLVIVDGYEQLSLLSRFRLRRLCRRQRFGLLITAHRGMGFPALHQSATSLELAERLAARLLKQPVAASQNATTEQPEIARAFAKHGGNLRDVWFALYDLHELQRLDQAKK